MIEMTKQLKAAVVKESKRIFLYYPRLSRMTDAFQSLEELSQMVLLPGSYNYELSEGYADTYEKKKLEKYAIVKAWQTLNERRRFILFCNYMSQNPIGIQETAYYLDLSAKTVETSKQKALISFAEEYKNGAIIKLLQNE